MYEENELLGKCSLLLERRVDTWGTIRFEVRHQKSDCG